MKTIREITRKGDPMLRIELPEIMIKSIEAAAKQNKRRTQDEFIKRITATFQHENQYKELSQKVLPELKEIYSISRKSKS